MDSNPAVIDEVILFMGIEERGEETITEECQAVQSNEN